MSEWVKLNKPDMIAEKNAVIEVFKKNTEAFSYLKKQIENVRWADPRYDELINRMNETVKILCDALETLTNGRDVFAISELEPLIDEYTRLKNKFIIY